MHQLVETRTAPRRVPARHRGWGARLDRRLRLLSVALGPEPEWDPVRLGRAHAMRRLRYEPVPGLSPPRRPSGHRRRPAPAGHRRQPRARPGSRVAGRGERECAHWGFIALPQEAERALKAAKGRQRPANHGGLSLRGRPQRDPRSPARQTMCPLPGPATPRASRKWSPDPLQEQENRAAARFVKPSAGLEPATPSLPWRSGHVAAASANGQSRCTSHESGCRSTPQPPARFDILRYPLGTRASTALRAQARTFGRSPWPTAHARDRATAMVEITTPKLDPAARISFVPLAKLRRVA